MGVDPLDLPSPHHYDLTPIRELAEQVFSRTAGASLVTGNGVRLLKDAKENYPAWMEAINLAERYIHFESYIMHDDETGRAFGEILAEKARQGVKVRIIYDWLGAFRKTSRWFWEHLRKAGAEVRCFNPPQIESPLGWLTRDHRKMVSVDGRVGFVSGLCIGRRWAGQPERSIEPWRDTGVEIKGPAVSDIDQAFNQVWSATGTPLPEEELPFQDALPVAGTIALRVIATVPNMAGLYRLDQLIAAIARDSLWLTDPYFVASTPYVQALCAAAVDGVDVRLLVPGTTDIPVIRALSRAGYQPLLEAGVRIFEWNGTMIHAKTAVADGRWARVGSTNHNLASWMGNYELDVAIEDEGFAESMERMYLEDLHRATELVLSDRRKIRLTERRHRRRSRYSGKIGTGSVGRAGAGAIRIGSAVGAAITNRRVLGSTEGKTMFLFAAILATLSIASLLWPRWVTVPLAFLGLWFAVSLLIRSYKLYKSDKEKRT
ncbi:MAG TPA: cardiolipin synthase B [Deltaproteobacteria bacterium]|nr:cardiolipin synthase B [Deltaproteobacteria bacterium]